MIDRESSSWVALFTAMDFRLVGMVPRLPDEGQQDGPNALC
ncbi:hypothetical protein [Pantoea sp. 1.19]|nr:hypothetical protein [Pantoea sp. 1.19]